MLFVETNTPDMFVREQRRDYTAFADGKQCVFSGPNHQANLSHVQPHPAYAVTVGIDWADLKHDVFERHPDGSLHHQQISSSPEAITNWLFALRSVSAEGRVAVAVGRTEI